MPPRPRPRPRPKPTPKSPAQTDPSSPSARIALSKKEEDEDDLFMRNKGRSLEEVNKRAQAAELAFQMSSPTGSDDEEDQDNEDTPKLGKKGKHNTLNKSNPLPKWAKKGGILNLLGNSDSDSENNRPSIYGSTPTKRRGGGTLSAAGTPSGKHAKRIRSRSRSLTPPPDLTLTQQMTVQYAIRNALKAENMLHEPTPVIMIEDDDDVGDVGGAELDPALQHIAQEVLERAARHKGRDVLGSTQGEPSRITYQPSSGQSPDVNVCVKWVLHPDVTMGQVRHQTTWSFLVNRHHPLKELLMQISAKSGIFPEDIVIMHDGKRVFTSVSVDGLGAWNKIDLEACDRTTFEALHARHFRSPTPDLNATEHTDLNREPSAAPSEASTENEDAENKFKLVLRAQGSKEVTLTVRPTTSCGKIVRAFLAIISKQGGVPTSPRKAARVRLCVDGEKQNPDTPIGDCDLEDGDMVEVVGL